ncbi:MAG: glycosyltransferase family 2 protein [Alphaproteobacteria bacterium]|nr:glycosyltransferase family 2 protein [Alphaproteobacteria bacterium]
MRPSYALSPIPVSVLVVTKNEEARIADCLRALQDFGEVIIVDSHSKDQTCCEAAKNGARVVSFQWNGQYPKKRQWCLDHLELKFDWVFFVDADEIVSTVLIDEIRSLFLEHEPEEAGFFITGRYQIGGRLLRFGIPNNKIALFHKSKMKFPVVDDLDLLGMGEIEGHYQPVCLEKDGKIGALRSYLVHLALEDERAWAFRHEKYAMWEAGMNRKQAWPQDPVRWREIVKSFLRRSRYRAEIIYFLGYFLRFGFLDGKAGLKLATFKYKYYRRISSIT